MSKAVIYARYSSTNQREESIEGQIRECTDFAKRQDITIVGSYIDRALTGKTDARPQFQKMISDSGKQLFDIVIVYTLDRFARNRYDSATYKAKLKKNGVKVISAKENITDDPSGIILESVLEGMAEYYSVELAQKVLRGMTENALDCKWLSGIIPLGYKLDDDKHLIIDDHAAPIVRKIFEMYAAGDRIVDIAKYANSTHLKTAKGNNFSRCSFTHMLKNETYIGTYKWRNIVKTKVIPRFIPDDLFYAVQKRIKSRKETNIRGKSENFLLSSKLKCGKCGQFMTGVSGTSKQKRRYYYYQCYASKSKKCDMPLFPREKLEDIILAETIKLLSEPHTIEFIANTVANLPIDENTQISILETEITEIKNKLKNCIKAVESGLLSDTISKNISEYEKKLSVLKKDLSIEKVLNEPFKITPDHVKFFLYNILQIKNTDERRDMIISTFVRDIVLTKDDIGYTVKITYNYNENPSTSLDNSVQKGSQKSSLVAPTRIELVISP